MGPPKCPSSISKSDLCSYPQEAHQYCICRLISELSASNSRIDFFWGRVFMTWAQSRNYKHTSGEGRVASRVGRDGWDGGSSE